MLREQLIKKETEGGSMDGDSADEGNVWKRGSPMKPRWNQLNPTASQE